MRVSLLSVIGFALVVGAASAYAGVECPESCGDGGACAFDPVGNGAVCVSDSPKFCLSDPTATVVVGGDEWEGCMASAGTNYCYEGVEEWECADGECQRMIQDHC